MSASLKTHLSLKIPPAECCNEEPFERDIWREEGHPCGEVGPSAFAEKLKCDVSALHEKRHLFFPQKPDAQSSQEYKGK
jgi:hypothetical protein